MNMRNKGLAILAGVGVAGLVGAAAASLNLTSSSLGSDTSVVAACDTDGIGVDYTTAYNATTQEFEVDSVVLTGVALACNGQDLSIVLSDGTSSLATYTGTAASATTTASLTTAVSASAVTDVAVVISG